MNEDQITEVLITRLMKNIMIQSHKYILRSGSGEGVAMWLVVGFLEDKAPDASSSMTIFEVFPPNALLLSVID